MVAIVPVYLVGIVLFVVLDTMMLVTLLRPFSMHVRSTWTMPTRGFVVLAALPWTSISPASVPCVASVVTICVVHQVTRQDHQAVPRERYLGSQTAAATTRPLPPKRASRTISNDMGCGAASVADLEAIPLPLISSPCPYLPSSVPTSLLPSLLPRCSVSRFFLCGVYLLHLNCRSLV